MRLFLLLSYSNYLNPYPQQALSRKHIDFPSHSCHITNAQISIFNKALQALYNLNTKFLLKNWGEKMPTNHNNTPGKSVTPYSHVQFIGYAISTVPKLYVENPNQPGINKYYLGLEDEKADIEARLELLSVALGEAQQAFQADDKTLRIFVIPEFFFRGSKGAYHSLHEDFLIAGLQAILQKHAPNIDLAVFGTSLFCPQKVNYAEPAIAKNFTLGDDFLNVYRACQSQRQSLGLATPSMQEMLFYLDELECLQDEQAQGPNQNLTQISAQNQNPKGNFNQTPGPRSPLESVLQEVLASADRQAPLLVSNVCQLFLSAQRHLRVQKKFKSKVDFVLNYYRNSARTQTNHNAYLQTFVKYPPIANANSELKTTDLDPYGVFYWSNLKIGVEICLDHIRQRMSRAVDDLDLQIIPSCGVEVTLNAVAARPGGYVFNCDGDYNLEDAQNGLGSHSQLYQVKQANLAVPNANESSNLHARQRAKLNERIPPKQIVKINAPNWQTANCAGVEDLFAFGAGELHVYPALPLPQKN